jgi:hypothetical protein
MQTNEIPGFKSGRNHLPLEVTRAFVAKRDQMSFFWREGGRDCLSFSAFALTGFKGGSTSKGMDKEYGTGIVDQVNKRYACHKKGVSPPRHLR